jgi:protein translocase SEC61 complex gamma subunit
MDLNISKKLGQFIDNAKHVLNISYKPTNEEFNRSARIIILGILLIGVLGLGIAIVASLVEFGTLQLIGLPGIAI